MNVEKRDREVGEYANRFGDTWEANAADRKEMSRGNAVFKSQVRIVRLPGFTETAMRIGERGAVVEAAPTEANAISKRINK